MLAKNNILLGILLSISLFAYPAEGQEHIELAMSFSSSSSVNTPSQQPRITVCQDPEIAGECGESCPPGKVPIIKKCEQDGVPITLTWCALDIECACNLEFEYFQDEDVCSYYDNETPTPTNIDVNVEDISGVAYSPETKTLFTIDNSDEDIIEIDTNGNFIRKIFTSGLDDPEGITHIDGNTFALVEEGRGILNIFTMPNNTINQINFSSTSIIKYDLFGNLGNTGLEGVVYDSIDNAYYIVKEAEPMHVYKLILDSNGTDFTIDEAFDASTLNCSNSLRGITINPLSSNLVIICEGDKKLIEVTKLGEEVSSMNIDQFILPEGVTFNTDNLEMYVVGEPKQFTKYPMNAQFINKFNPIAFENHLAWTQKTNADYKIHLLNLETGTKTIPKPESINQSSPAISRDLLVWIDTVNGFPNIFGYNLHTGQTMPIATGNFTFRDPDIFDNKLVWTDNRTGQFEVYYCEINLNNGDCFPEKISSSSAFHDKPAIWADHIVWVDYQNGFAQIFYHHPNGSNIAISPSDFGQYEPDIVGTTVVWKENRTAIFNVSNIYKKPLLSGIEENITNTLNFDYSKPFATKDENGYEIMTVSQIDFSGNSDVILFNLHTNNSIQITSHPAQQNTPTAAGHTVFWTDDRLGGFEIFSHLFTPEDLW